MVLREELQLDLSRAQDQIDDLERRLNDLLGTDIEVGVTFDEATGLRQLEADLARVDNQQIDVGVDVEGVTDADQAFRELSDELDEVEDDLIDVARRADDVGDELEDAGKRGKTGIGNFRTELLKLGGAFLSVAALREGAQRLAEFATVSIAAASDLAESTSKAETVFGDFSDEIFEFTDNAPQALGLSTAAATEFAGTFGNLFVALGLSQEAAADLSPEIVQLGADLASFNNLEVDDALEKLRSGLVGEIEPLRALGVSFNAAQVEAKAFELGLVGINGEVSEAAKVQARYALILEQTAVAQGDFARTSDGIANRQRTITAEFENAQAAIGEALIPAYEALLDLAPAVIGVLEDLGPVAASAASAFVSLAESTDEVPSALSQIPGILSGIQGGLGTVGDIAFGASDALSGLFSLFTLDDQGVSDQLDQFAGRIENVFERIATTGLVDALAEGRSEVNALGDSLLFLSRQDLFAPDALINGFERLATVAGVTDTELEAVVNNLLANRVAYDLTGNEILFLEGKLNDLAQAAFAAQSAYVPFRGTVFSSEASSEIQEQASAISILQAEAETLGLTLADVAAGAGGDSDTLVAALEAVPEATLEWAIAAERIDDFASAVTDSLADSINVFAEVPDQIRSFGKEATTALSVEDFLDNLTTTAQEQAAFEANLAQLFLIAPKLAETLQSQGVASRGLVSGFLEDTFSAEQAESILTGQAQDIVGTFSTGLEAAIISGDLDAPGATAAAEFISGFASVDLVSEIQSILDRLALSLALNVPISFTTSLRTDSAGNIVTPTADQAERILTGSSGGGVTVNNTINNPTTSDLPADTATLTQQTGAAAALLSGAQ